MFFIFLSALFSVMIANYLHYISHKNLSVPYIFFGNYLFAFSILLIQSEKKQVSFLNYDLLLALFAGFMFVVNLLLYKKNVVKNGVSLSVSFMRIAVIIPVLLSFLIFSETVSLISLTGIILSVLIILSLCEFQKKFNILLALSLFIVTGFTDYLLKIHQSISLIPDSQFLALLFFSAVIFSGLSIIITKSKFDWKSLCFGFGLGIPNLLTSVFFLKGLHSVPSIVCYPMNASLIILGSFLSDSLIWKTRFSRKQVLLYLFLLISIFILNTGLHR